MGLFRGQFGNNNKATHIFTCNDQGLIYGGLASFTLEDLDSIKQSTFHQKNLNDGLKAAGMFTLSSFDLEDVMLVSVAKDTFTYQKFNESSKKYVSTDITAARVIQLINWYEDEYLPNIQNFANQRPGNLEEIQGIQNSLDECAIATGAEGVFFKVFFGDKGQIQRDRVIAHQGPPMWSDIPRTPAGTPYSLSSTKGAGIGNYRQSKEADRRQPGDAVTATARWSYDQSTGTWEMPSTILAKLLEQLDPAPVPLNDMTKAQADSTGTSVFYDTSATRSEAGFSSAIAMPLSIEQGNPHMFGPNMIDCDGTIRPEKIRVVNRGPKTFLRGARVMCHWVGGEWIVIDWGEDPEIEPPETKINPNWKFAKYITSSETHFTTQNQANALGPLGFLDIEETLREKFYQNGNINFKAGPVYLDANSFKVNTKIMQSSIFDQIALGANYHRVNLSSVAGSSFDGFYLNSEYPFFWGPVFKGGTNKTFVPTNEDGDTLNIVEVTSDPHIKTAVGIAEREISEAIFDRRDVPAELAINSFDSPIESYHVIAAGVNSNKYDFLSSKSHYNYRQFSNGTKNTLEPRNPGKIQFTALTNAFAIMDDTDTSAANEPYIPKQFRRMRDEYAGVEQFFPPLLEPLTPIPADMGLGDALTRGNPQTGNNGITVPYDQYSDPVFPKQTASAIAAFLTHGDGGQDGAEINGIITAKNTVTRSGGGVINFQAGGFFGAFAPADTNVATGVVQGFLRDLVGVFTSGGNRLGQRSATWGIGSSDPTIDQFGDTVLYVRVYDFHPDDATVFIGPYFAVLHFNQGAKGSDASTEDITFRVFEADDPEVESGEAAAGSIDYLTITDGTHSTVNTQSIDVRDFDCDLRRPTDYSGRSMLASETVASGVQLMRPEEYWNVDTLRRGQMLTGGDFLDTDGVTERGGFAYQYPVIGLNTLKVYIPERVDNNGNVVQGDPVGGEGFTTGVDYEGPNGIKVNVTVGANGTVTGATFASEVGKYYRNDSFKQRGEGFMPDDFRGGTRFTPGFTFDITPVGEGFPATLVAEEGVVYFKEAIDYAPRYFGFQRLSNGPTTNANGPGTEAVQTSKTTQITVEANDSGAYDCFYYFKNDITHTTFEEDNPQGYDRVQYIDLTVS